MKQYTITSKKQEENKMEFENDLNKLLNENNVEGLLKEMEQKVKKSNEETWEHGMVIVNTLASNLFSELMEIQLSDIPTSEKINKIKPILVCLSLIKELRE